MLSINTDLQNILLRSTLNKSTLDLNDAVPYVLFLCFTFTSYHTNSMPMAPPLPLSAKMSVTKH